LIRATAVTYKCDKAILRWIEVSQRAIRTTIEGQLARNAGSRLDVIVTIPTGSRFATGN